MFKKQKRIIQGEIWVNSENIALPEACQFYEKLNAMLDSAGFDEKVQKLCEPYYRLDGPGQPGVDPAVYFRILMIGFFEGIGSERALEARCADSINLRRFLRLALEDRVPDHSTLGKIRRRYDVTTFDQVFTIMHPVLASLGLLRGAHVGMDTSVMDANASMRALKHRLTGEKYRNYIKRLAKAEGVNTRDEAAVSRFDKKRKGRKTSNKEWENPHDPDAKIGPTKHGETRMIYKPEHTVDMETGALIDARVQPGDMGDPTEVARRIVESEARAIESLPVDELPIETLTGDKGYHSAEEIERLADAGIHANIPDRSLNRCFENLSAKRRRTLKRCARMTKSRKGKDLLRKRGMYIERSFAHLLDAGGMRRTTLRGLENIQKRYSIAALGYNLSLLMLDFFGIGTPKQAIAKAKRAILTTFSHGIPRFTEFLRQELRFLHLIAFTRSMSVRICHDAQFLAE